MAATQHGTLVANTPTTVTLDGIIRGFRVTNRAAEGGEDIWWTFGFNAAATPTVAGAGTYNLPAGQQDEETDAPYRAQRFGGGITSSVFKLISTGAVDYSVETW